MDSLQRPYWFNSKAIALLLIIVAIIPLLGPAVPPLTDLPGHIGRYKIELDLHHSAFLQQWFSFRWALFGNLGVDLLVVPLTKILALEPAVKLIVIAIPPLTMVGMLYLAREIHGRVPATAFFALPLAYGHPFQFGFVNFTLSVALTFLFAGLWLHLGRLRRLRLRSVLFVGLSLVLFIAHCVGWAIFGVLLFSIELIGRRELHRTWRQSVCGAAVALLPLASPLLLILNWANYGPSGETVFYPWYMKLYQLEQVLRDRSELFDIWSALLLYTIVFCGLRHIGVRCDKRLGVAALLLGIAYWATPGILKDVACADARMLPATLALALLGLAPVSSNRRWHYAMALAGLTFFAARMASQFITYRELDRGYQQQLLALDHIERGSRVFVMADTPCSAVWNSTRTYHLGSLAIARREAFANGMWSMPGGRLMSITYDAAGHFTYSPSQILKPEECHVRGSESLSDALRELPRQAFDYVWLIDLPPQRWPRVSWLLPVWHGKTGVLFRIDRNSLTMAGRKA